MGDDPPGDGPRPPRLPRIFDRGTVQRLAAEFVVIVVGVLVAFAVDDWQAGRERERAALRLLNTMEADIAETVADLREAEISARLRTSALAELLRLVGEPPPPDGGWQPWSEVVSDEARGTISVPLPVTGFRALTTLPMYVQVFDPRTASFDEMRSTGVLATIPDTDVRREIVSYFGGVLDFAESNQFYRTDQFALQDALQGAGLVAGDWIDEEAFIRRLRASDEARAAVRRNFLRALEQTRVYPQLADTLESRGYDIVSRARASLRRQEAAG